MRRAVALLVGVLLMAGCSTTVDGQATTDAAAGPGGRTATAAPADPGTPPGAVADPTPDATSTELPGTAAPTTNSPAPNGPTGSSPTEGAPTDSAPTANAPTDSAPQLPTGFYGADTGADTGLGYRPMSTDEFDCTPDQASGCFGIMVFSAAGCPIGATVTVGIFDKAVDPVNPLGSASGVTPAISAAGSQAVVIADSTGVTGQLTARVQSVTC